MLGKRAFIVGGGACLLVLPKTWTWFCSTDFARTNFTTKRLEWNEQNEPEPFEGARDYVLYEQSCCLGLPVVRSKKGMFRLKVEPAKQDEADLVLLDMTPWSGSIISPDEKDVETAKVLVSKLTRVAQEKHVKIVRAGIILGQTEMFESCGFQRDEG
jgi:hypothetical protein